MINSHKVYIIAAVDAKGGIGRGGALPWRLKKEMRHFTETTRRTSDPRKQNMVVMGRTTWESVPEKYRPLPGRRNVVLTRQRPYHAPGAIISDSLDEALGYADDSIENIFIIGGAQVYSEALKHPALDGIYLTKIKKDFDCDTFFPPLDFGWLEQSLGADEEDGIIFEYKFFSKRP